MSDAKPCKETRDYNDAEQVFVGVDSCGNKVVTLNYGAKGDTSLYFDKDGVTAYDNGPGGQGDVSSRLSAAVKKDIAKAVSSAMRDGKLSDDEALVLASKVTHGAGISRRF